MRQSLLAARRAHADAHGTDAAAALATHADKLSGQNIAAYLPMGGEIDPRPLMQALRRQGSGICLPVCVDEEAAMIFRRYRDGDALIPDEMGIAAPRARRSKSRPILFCCRFWRLTARAIGSVAAVAFTTAHWPHCANAARAALSVWRLTCKWLTNVLSRRMTRPCTASQRQRNGMILMGNS